MKQGSDNPRFSETISSFVSMMENAKKDYDWNNSERERLEKLTQDYLHSLELDGLDYKQRARIATQLALCRQKRRSHKNMVLALDPLITFLDSDKGKQMLNLLKEALGKTRKIESYMEHRKYFKRVLDTDEQKGNSEC